MSEVAEKAAEVTAEVVEETVDGVVDVVEVMRNNPVTLALVGAAGLAVGGAGGYFLTKRLLRKYYSDLAEVEIAQAKEFYAGVYKTDADGAVLTPQEVLSQRHGAAAAADALRTYSGRQVTQEILEKDEMATALDEQDEAAVIRLEERARHEEPRATPSEMRNVFIDPSFDYEEEKKLRSRERPYIITHDEYFDKDVSFEDQTLTYYEDDDTLVDEKDKPVDDLDLVGEDHLARFGHGSRDRNIVYVRNEKLEMDFEIVLAKGSYLEALGLGPEPEGNSLKHSSQRDARRAFRHGDG